MRTTLLVLAALALAAPALGAYSGLMLIPTADMLGPGQVCVDYWLDGSFPVGSGVGCALLDTQYGVGDHLEVGVDLDISQEADPIALFNAKLKLRSLDSGLGLAAGMYSIGENLAPTTYVVATKPVSDRFRLHAGAQRTPDDHTQAITGCDYYFEGRLGLFAEYVAGDESNAMLSVYYQLTDEWGLTFGWGMPNDPDADDWWAVNIGCIQHSGCEEEPCTSQTEP